MTLDEISDYIVAQHAATKPVGEFQAALAYAEAGAAAWKRGQGIVTIRHNRARDTHLLILTIRALRNQGQPYYDARQP